MGRREDLIAAAEANGMVVDPVTGDRWDALTGVAWVAPRPERVGEDGALIPADPGGWQIPPVPFKRGRTVAFRPRCPCGWTLAERVVRDRKVDFTCPKCRAKSYTMMRVDEETGELLDPAVW